MDTHSILCSPIVSVSLFIVGSAVLAKIWSRKPKYVKVTEIWIYPIKSCKGMKLNYSPVTKTGFLYDRQFMLVDVKGRFLCQRRFPRMALIETRIIDNGIVGNWIEAIQIAFQFTVWFFLVFATGVVRYPRNECSWNAAITNSTIIHTNYKQAGCICVGW